MAVLYYLYRRYEANAATTAAAAGTDTAVQPADTTGSTSADGSGGGGAFDPTGLVTALGADLTDPATGDPYFQELATANATLTTDYDAIEQQFATLQATYGPNGTATVATPSASGSVAPIAPGVNVAPAAAPTPIAPVTGISGTPAQIVQSVGTAANSIGAQVASFTSQTIAKQIADVNSGKASVSQLGPNARTIYNAGGVSTALPTKAAVTRAQKGG